MLRRTRPAKQVATVTQLTHEIRENLSLIDRMTGKDAPSDDHRLVGWRKLDALGIESNDLAVQSAGHAAEPNGLA